MLLCNICILISSDIVCFLRILYGFLTLHMSKSCSACDIDAAVTVVLLYYIPETI